MLTTTKSKILKNVPVSEEIFLPGEIEHNYTVNRLQRKHCSHQSRSAAGFDEFGN